jgi:RHS repeat-associated protein
LDKNRPYAQVLAEYTNGSLDASYFYGLDLISQERGNSDSYYLVDGLGSTRGLTDENGNVTDVYNYDAYGNLTDSVGSSENDYLFAGEQFDENLEQYYLRQRYYDPSVGRFTRRDTYEGDNFDPITLHKYLYANGNPINGIDPSGLYAIQQELTSAKVVGDILAVLTYAYIQVSQDPPERLGGFGEGVQPTLDLYPHPRDPRDSLLARLLSYPGGFGAGQQPNLPTHTGHPRDNTIYDLISYIFNTTTITFPSNPDDLTATLGVSPSKDRIAPKHSTRKVEWRLTPDIMIRYESHPKDLGSYNPRHHGEHYHVLEKPSGTKWNKVDKKLITKYKPPGYKLGHGTGFLPGETITLP